MSDDFKQSGGSPWGSPPGGGGSNNGSGRGPTPPNVDELIKDIQDKIKLIDFPLELLPPGKNFFILSCKSLINSSTFGGVGPLPDPLPLPPPGGAPHGLCPPPLKSSDICKLI